LATSRSSSKWRRVDTVEQSASAQEKKGGTKVKSKQEAVDT